MTKRQSPIDLAETVSHIVGIETDGKGNRMIVRATFHDGELKRWDVPVRCTSRNVKAEFANVVMTVFATSEEGARFAAIDKITDKYLRHQNKRTTWVVTGEPVES